MRVPDHGWLQKAELIAVTTRRARRAVTCHRSGCPCVTHAQYGNIFKVYATISRFRLVAAQ